MCFGIPARRTKNVALFLVPYSSYNFIINSSLIGLMRHDSEDPTFVFLVLLLQPHLDLFVSVCFYCVFIHLIFPMFNFIIYIYIE